MKLHFTLAASLLLATLTTAQTQLVRGDVDSVSQSNRFVLKCTQIELVSTSVNLQQLHDASQRQDIEYEMQVKDVSQGSRRILEVLAAKQIPQLMDMGNLRLGRSDSWQVRGAPGSFAAVMLQHESRTSYLPLGNFGAWLLGLDYGLLTSGRIDASGSFRFQFQPPQITALVGQTFVSQALVFGASPASLLLTNADCKAVRND